MRLVVCLQCSSEGATPVSLIMKYIYIYIYISADQSGLVSKVREEREN